MPPVDVTKRDRRQASAPALSGPLGQPDPTSRFSLAVAAVAVAMVGADMPVAFGLSTASLAAFGLMLTWLRQVPRYQGASALFAIAAAAIANGIALGLMALPNRASSDRLAMEQIVLLSTAVATVGLLLWVRKILPMRAILVIYGAAAVATALAGTAGSLNAWKYQLATPVTVLVLGMLHLPSRKGAELVQGVVLIGLAGIGLVFDSRSYAGFCLLTVALLVLQRAVSGAGLRRSRGAVMLATTLVAVAGYQLLTAALVGGYLGEQVQERSIAQIERAGSLLAGGRPEWSATTQLFAADPFGHGLGVLATSDDVLVAKRGLQAVGLETSNNGYVDRYMFGNGFELHSTLADMWSTYGVFGIVLGVWIAYVLLRSLLTSMGRGRATGAVLYLTGVSLWLLAFGPMSSDLPIIAFTLGLVMSAKADDQATDPDAEASDDDPTTARL